MIWRYSKKRAAIFLVLGAMVNVVVAWGCTILADYSNAHEAILLVNQANGLWKSTAYRESMGTTQFVDRIMIPTSVGVGGNGEYYLNFPELQAGQAVRKMSPRQSLQDEFDDLSDRWAHGDLPAGLVALWPWENRAGWPMRSMASWCVNLAGVPSRFSWATLGPVEVEWGIQLPDLRRAPEPRVLPMYPLWAGTIVNSIFYAVLLAVCGRWLTLMKRRRRLARGVCPACTYPIGQSSVCTECGTDLPQKKLVET